MYFEPQIERPKLRIGVMLNSFTVEAWLARVLNDVLNAPYLEVALIILNRATTNAPPPKPWKSLKSKWPTMLYRLYRRVDTMFYQEQEKERNAFATVDVRHLLSGRDRIEIMPIQKKFVDRFEESDIEQIKDANLDVILRFGFRVIKGEILNCAKHGVWSFHHDDSRYYRGGPPLFWEIYENNPVSGTILQVLNESLDGGRILYRSHSATDFTSLYRNKNNTYWKTAEFVVRRLRQLYAFGWDSITKLDTYNEVNHYEKPVYRAPNNYQMLRFLAKRGVIYFRNRIHGLQREQWFLAIQRCEPTAASISKLDIIMPARERFYADPFLFSQGGRKFIFFENYEYRTEKGSISCLEVNRNGSYSKPVTVLERDYHLSYPFLFQWESDIFMMPETHQNRTVEVYRAIEFPHTWELHATLISNVAAFDPTLLRYGGRYWLFVSMAGRGSSLANDELFLFGSDSPFGPWLPHPQNPIVSDVRKARPAGRIIEQDGQLIRPSQDCSVRYGHKIKLNRIDVLTEDEYRESEVGEIAPSWVSGIVATHTLSVDESLQVLDGCRSINRLWPGILQVPRILTRKSDRRHSYLPVRPGI